MERKFRFRLVTFRRLHSVSFSQNRQFHPPSQRQTFSHSLRQAAHTEGLIHAETRSISGHISDYEENVTVLVRAEYRNAPNQLTHIRWCATSVHMQIRIGQSSPFVVVANSFGWVVISREHQAECKTRRRSGDVVKFKACANMPCIRYG
uniref:Uncharacterized protein n=1 Tax=Romanomermis culicivorax TaxID=13658 RepID=A0A915KY20_ROMCU